MKIIIIIIIQFFTNFLNAQNVKLSGYIYNANDSSEIWFCRSIDGNPINYCGMYDKTIINDKKFEKILPITTTNIITIAPNDFCPKISLICDKDDSIKLEVTQGSNSLFYIKFKGSNAAGQMFFYNSPLFHNYQLIPLLSVFTEDMLENNFTVMLAVTKLDSIKNKLFSTADSLYFNKKISKHFYELIKLQSDAQFLFSLESSIQNSLDKISLSNKNIYLNKAQLLSIEIQKIYYNRYDPFSSIYNSIDQNLRIINCQNKCRLIENRILSGEKKDIGLWTRPDEQSYSFAPIALQHTMMAIHLSYNGFYKLDRGNLNDSADFELLKKNFPNSPYIPILNRYFKKKIDYFDYK